MQTLLILSVPCLKFDGPILTLFYPSYSGSLTPQGNSQLTTGRGVPLVVVACCGRFPGVGQIGKERAEPQLEQVICTGGVIPNML